MQVNGANLWGSGEGYCALDWVGRDGSAVRELWEGLPRDLQGSKSRPKAAMLMATTMALQEAKKSHAALERNESLRVMTVDPLLVFCIYPCSASVFCFAGARRAREASRRAIKNSLLSPLVIDNEESYFPCHRALLLRGRRRLVHVALHAGFVLGYHLLGLGLLVRGQQLEQLVVNLGLRHRQLGFDLSFL